MPTASAPHPTQAPLHEDSPPQAAPHERWGRIGALLVVALISGLLGYGGGLLHGWQRSRPEQQRLQHSIEANGARLERMNEELRGAEQARLSQTRTIELFEAYREVQRALQALDARNFGIAESHLRSSEEELRALSASEPALAPVLQRVVSTRVTVAEDLAAERAALLSIASLLDDALTAKLQAGTAKTASGNAASAHSQEIEGAQAAEQPVEEGEKP